MTELSGHGPEIPQLPRGAYEKAYHTDILTDPLDKRYALGTQSQVREGKQRFHGIEIDHAGLPIPRGNRAGTDLPEIHFTTGINGLKAHVVELAPEHEHAEPLPMHLADIETLIEGVMKRDWSNIRNRKNPRTLTMAAVDGVIDALHQSGMLQLALNKNTHFLDELIQTVDDRRIQEAWSAFKPQPDGVDEAYQDVLAAQGADPIQMLGEQMPKATLDYPEVLLELLPEKFECMNPQKTQDIGIILSTQVLPSVAFPAAQQILQEHEHDIAQLGSAVDLEKAVSNGNNDHHRGLHLRRRRR
jgi:hypothetical protein